MCYLTEADLALTFLSGLLLQLLRRISKPVVEWFRIGLDQRVKLILLLR